MPAHRVVSKAGECQGEEATPVLKAVSEEERDCCNEEEVILALIIISNLAVNDEHDANHKSKMMMMMMMMMMHHLSFESCEVATRLSFFAMDVIL